MTPPKIKDRDAFVSKDRPPTAAPAVEIDEETSEAYEIGEPRNSFRAKRDTRERLAKIEEFKDNATAQFTEIKNGLAEVRDSQADSQALVVREVAGLAKEVAGLAGQFKGVADVLTRQENLTAAERQAELERAKIISAAAAKQAEIAATSSTRQAELNAASAAKQAELKSASAREIIKQVGPWIVAIGAVVGAIIHALITSPAKP